jgi:chorismate synthase
MSSIWNNGIQLSVFGESHSQAIGVVIDHLPAGKPIDFAKVREFMRRRQAKSDGTTTSRIEPDLPEVLSGYYQGKTTGTPLAILIKNTNTRSQDYRNIEQVARPGHADYTGFLRYHGANDPRGGGHFSGRLTAPLVAAGAVCGQILETYGVSAVAHLLSVHRIQCEPLDTQALTKEQIQIIRALPFPVIEEAKRKEIISFINEARMAQNSVGGVVECAAIGMPAGIGSPIFDNLESILASLLFSIPGVKGVEFGAGFACTEWMGSENNDSFTMEDGVIKTKTNHHGGILGGISSGMPIYFKTAFKPTASISLEQDSVNFRENKEEKLRIVGRHDPCIAVRAVPVVEACCNIGLLSAILSQNGVA